MRVFFFIVLLLCGCSEPEFPWKNVNFEEAQTMATNSNKMIMLDFYANW